MSNKFNSLIFGVYELNFLILWFVLVFGSFHILILITLWLVLDYNVVRY